MLALFGNAGIVFLVTGIVLMCTWCCHYGLCCRKDKPKDGDYNGDYPNTNYDNYNYSYNDKKQDN